MKTVSSSIVLLCGIWLKMTNAKCSTSATLPRIPMVEPDSWFDSDNKDRSPLHGENHAHAATGSTKTVGSKKESIDAMPAISDRRYPSPLGTDVNWRFDLRCTIQKEMSQNKAKRGGNQQRMFDLRENGRSQTGFHEPFFPCDSDDAAEHDGSFHVSAMKEVRRCPKSSSLNQRKNEKVLALQF